MQLHIELAMIRDMQVVDSVHPNELLSLFQKIEWHYHFATRSYQSLLGEKITESPEIYANTKTAETINLMADFSWDIVRQKLKSRIKQLHVNNTIYQNQLAKKWGINHGN